MTYSKAIEILSSFEGEIDSLYPSLVLDYRGREINSTTVLEYLRTEKYRFAEIATLFPPPPHDNSKLLDVGVAYGFLPSLLKMTTPWKCEGIELPENIPAYCRFAQNHGVPIHPGTLGLASFPFKDGRFDGVIFSEVLEHLRLSPGVIFQELNRVLAPQGFLLITTPNIARLTNILKLLFGKNILESFPEDIRTQNITEHLTHIREYTMGELIDLLKNNGFEPVKIHYSSCMEKTRPHRFLTQCFPPWRGNLMVLARKAS